MKIADGYWREYNEAVLEGYKLSTPFNGYVLSKTAKIEKWEESVTS